jgi:hypothetical protein
MISQLPNRRLFAVLICVFVTLLGGIALTAYDWVTNGMVVILCLPPITYGAILLVTSVRAVRSSWMELDCLPPYRHDVRIKER